MESQLRTEPLGIVILALAFATVGLSACNDDAQDLATVETQTFIGTRPAPPSAAIETPTPVEAMAVSPKSPAGKESNIAKDEESKDMPLPGQANDHSTLSPKATQKSETAPGNPQR